MMPARSAGPRQPYGLNTAGTAMIIQAILPPLINAMTWLIPLMILGVVLRSPWFKGWFGEQLVRLFAHYQLDRQTYRRLHDVTLTTPDGTTQIDHVFVSPFGIFVVETKNMSGWIFGGEKQAQWTQQIYKRRFRFQNPLRQNYKHLKALEAALGVTPELSKRSINPVRQDGVLFRT